MTEAIRNLAFLTQVVKQTGWSVLQWAGKDRLFLQFTIQKLFNGSPRPIDSLIHDNLHMFAEPGQ